MNEDADVVARMPIDPDLLVPLGKVMWAAIRLHAGLRDSINAVENGPSDEPFDQTLGQAIDRLERGVGVRMAEPARTLLLDWITDVARPASQERNGVAHAVAITAEDGKQVLKGRGRNRPVRYLGPELQTVAADLIRADISRPRQPYPLAT